MIPAKRLPGSKAVNSHTFLSITSAVQQLNTLAEELGRLDPPHAGLFRANALTYARQLRELLGEALSRIDAEDAADIRIATVHDGYAYLFEELGLQIAAVVQPQHGIEPSPRQLADTLRRIQAADVNILFTEMDYGQRLADIIRTETGASLFRLTHIARGAYHPERFARDMARNLDTIVTALQQSFDSEN